MPKLDRLLVLIGIFSFVVGQSVYASDYKNYKYPLFIDVKRAFISVEYVSYAILPEEIPPHLTKDELEKMLLQAYQERFSSSECSKWIVNRAPYSCDNQPVVVVPEEERSKYLSARDTSFASSEDLHDPGTLNIALRVEIQGNRPGGYDPPLTNPIVTFQLIQDRPKTNVPIGSRVAPAMLVQLDQGADATKERLVRYLKHWIN